VAPNYAFRSAPSRSTHEEPRYAKDDEEVEAGWDVYADFNNAGPRYAPFPGKSNSSYRPIGGSKPEPLAPAQDPNTPGVELVTVPALGAEWKADELKAMTKRGRREAKNDERQRKWKDWNRDNTACCGGYVTRRRVVWGLFGTIIVVGVLLAFMIPRAPPFAFIGNSPLVAVDGGSFEYTRIPPANFSFASTAMLEVSTSDNFLPLHFNHIYAEAYTTSSLKKVGTGDIWDYTVPAKTFTPINMTLNFAYEGTNDTDTTWMAFHDACSNRNHFPDKIRPGLNLKLILYLDIAGLVTKTITSLSLNSIPCPYELSSTAN
jgi:hypothetical protein